MREVQVVGTAVVIALMGLTACTATTSAPTSAPAPRTEPAATQGQPDTGEGEPADDQETTAPATAGATEDPGATEAATTPAVAPAAREALDFRARRVGGGEVDARVHAGGHVALWMWAPWCPQCNREAPDVARVAQRFGDRVTFIGIAGHDTDAAHEAFVDRHGLHHVVHAIDDGGLWARYGISYQPAWVFIAPDGTMERHAGGLYSELDARVLSLLDR